jgi:ABC-type molybdate transport system ATPase subunit
VVLGIPHGRASPTHSLLHVEHLVPAGRRTIAHEGGELQLLKVGAVLLAEPMVILMSGGVPVESAHDGLAKRAVVDHVVLVNLALLLITIYG